MSSELSGVDLARQALVAAREAAKKNGASRKEKPKRRTGTAVRRDGREPLGLGAAIGMMMTERGMVAPAAGGSVLAQWETILAAAAPELTGHVQAVRFDAETGRLDVAPDAPAYGTKLRWTSEKLIAQANQQVKRAAVRTLHVLPPAPVMSGPATAAAAPAPQPAAPAGPARKRQTAPAGYHRAKAELRAHKSDRPVDPEVQAARDRHTASPRMREPERLFGYSQAALEETLARAEAVRVASEAAERAASMEVSHARALRRLAAERAGLVPQGESPLGRTA
ncbi:DciA family protein [Streptomyces scopuliridis]|uniref:DciA family protein n=1 Tax=Streptomyces scopuliridis TaxID=452529 RepID=UPI0036B30C81